MRDMVLFLSLIWVRMAAARGIGAIVGQRVVGINRQRCTSLLQNAQ
jgi:hypothetical protein